jgi:adenosylcobyric acid synthase
VFTEFAAEKSTRQVRAHVVSDPGLLAGTLGKEISGYEIHMGQTHTDEKSSVLRITETPQGPADYADGAVNTAGTVIGTYLHGLFHNDEFRQAFLNNLRLHWGLPDDAGNSKNTSEEQYDKLAALVRQSLKIPEIYRITEGQV